MLELTFVTSSAVKREHARHICREFDVSIVEKTYYGKTYEEPRIFERDDLLKQSIEDALVRWRKNVSNADKKFFFIEDTSVVIHVLSTDDHEVPGVDIKYWMQENTFNSIDALLKENGNDRSVTVRSDLILTLTSDLKEKLKKPYVRFSSETHGKIADKEYSIQTNPVYPWLDNKSFNKWFVPKGSDLPISLLNINDADKFDFRKRAFLEMLSFLDEHGKLHHLSQLRQQSFEFDPPLFLISGPTCAGKTTLAEHLVDRYGYYHIEASDFMHLSYHQKLGVGSSTPISHFAKEALNADPEIVVNAILDYVSDRKEIRPFLITGLRTKQEIEVLIQKNVSSQSVMVITIGANRKIREERYLQRNRGGKATAEKFIQDCKIQDEMGLKELMRDYSQNLLNNEKNMADFFKEFTERYKSYIEQLRPLKHPQIEHLKPEALEDAILLSLLENSDYLTTTEIAHKINQTFVSHGIEKSKNNVSRYFNQSFYPFYDATNSNGLNKYRLSQTGKMHARYIAHKLCQ